MAGAIAPMPVAKASKTKAQGNKGRSTDAPARQRAASEAMLPSGNVKLSDAEKAAVAAKRKAAADRRKARLADEERSADAAIRSGAIKQTAPVQTVAMPGRHTGVDLPAPRVGAAMRPPEVRTTAGGQRVVTHQAPRVAMPQVVAGARPVRSAKPSARVKVPTGKFPKNGTVTTAAPAAKQVPAAAPRRESSSATKQCRRCSASRPLSDFFVDKRIEGGFMNYCAPCAKHKGLSGRPPTAAEVAEALAKLQPASAKRALRAAGTSNSAGPRANGKQAFYAPDRAGRQPPRQAPAVAAVRNGSNKRARAPDLDTYEDDFVDEDLGGEDDWRAELLSVTRGFYREDRSDEPFNDSAMVASAADMRREEARSRRLGRQEDLQAEREELQRVAAKEAKLARARKRHRAKLRADGAGKKARSKSARMFLDDGSDEDDDEAELSLSE